jgi:uncharacterized membrane protein YkvA (DUF1232 family)
MANKRDIMIPPQGGIVRDFIMRVKLILRLLGDKRVNPWLKVIPIAGLAYLVSPIDLIPDIALPVIGELDDAAVLWLTNVLFVELCPPEVVAEHIKFLTANAAHRDEDDVIEGETIDIKDQRK